MKVEIDGYFERWLTWACAYTGKTREDYVADALEQALNKDYQSEHYCRMSRIRVEQKRVHQESRWGC